ncbi:hypothetical protein CPB85DRAFT_1431005 [Mucidula mucida]|nr:hypothetical protein CPB85DRAFT_1431005 [Mucidula mucida]
MAPTPFLTLPNEITSEIFSYLRQIPLEYYHDTYGGSMGSTAHLRWRERTEAVRALSQTCKALQTHLLPWAWERFDCCFVPPARASKWFIFVMSGLQRKAAGMKKMGKHVKESVRTLSIVLTKSDVEATLRSLKELLQMLPNLRTLHVIHCKTPGALGKAIKDLQLPSVATLIVPTEAANAVIGVCPNVLHIRCAGGAGSTIIGGLKKLPKCQVLDGMIDWVKDPKLVDRLVKSAPSSLHTVEIRRPVCEGLGISSQDTAPAEWANIIPKLVQLKSLKTLIVTFPKATEEPMSDQATVDAATKVMRTLKRKGEETKLIVRRIQAPHYDTGSPKEEDRLVSEEIEIFD